MKKFLFVGLLAVPFMSFAEDTLESLKAELAQCKKTEKESICFERIKPRLGALIKKTEDSLHQVKQEMLAWSYSSSTDKMRDKTSYTARKISNEYPDSKNGAMILLSTKDNDKILLSVLNSELNCSSGECNVAYRFDSEKVIELSLKQISEAGVIMRDQTQIKEFAESLKNSTKMILELPTIKGTMQYEFDLTPALKWEHF